MAPKLLLHACCGVCSSYVPERLMPDYNVTIYFENSNIYPAPEFYKRRDAALAMANKFGLPFMTADYDSVSWFKATRGLAREPERGTRCEKCITLRLGNTMRYAKENGFDWVATTLSVSRRKNAEQINAIGAMLSESLGIGFLGKDWKKEEGEKISQQRAKDAGIYRQDYCGCIYSLLERKKQG